jgi:phosphoribosylamine--glycine ligase
MLRLKNDLGDLLWRAAAGSLADVQVQQDPRAACTVMAVSGGYPGDYKKGKKIVGVDTVGTDNQILFHAGTAMQGDDLVTQGGRVLCISAYGSTLPEAVAASKLALRKISFDDMYYRDDIGYEFC